MQLKIEKIETISFDTCIVTADDVNTCVVILSGSMDTNPVIDLYEKVRNIILRQRYNIIVDLSRVEYISSTGLGLLLYLYKNKKDALFLSSPPEVILKPFKLLHIDDLFRYYENPDDLLKEGIAAELVQILKQEVAQANTLQYTKRWVKILKDFLTSHDEVMKEIKQLSPYIMQADHQNSVTIPSDVKYACILYKFLNRIFTKVLKYDEHEVDDLLVELVSKELLTNAVKHGYGYNKEGVIEADFKVEHDQLEINVIDYGKGISPSDRKKSMIQSHGIELLKKIFDEVTLSDAPKKKVSGLVLGKGTRVRMIKHLKGKGKT
jgi:anti-anti-sigma factor